jgi:hypothetical protein
MVSLEKQMSYNQRIETNPKLTALKNMLSGKSIISPDSNLQISETDKIYYEITTAIQTNDKERFIEFFNKKNKSNPNKDNPQPFVHDDFLIFSLIIGIMKFDCDKVWIKHVISTRIKNNITTTFDNILNGDFFHSENIKSIVFMYFNLIDQNQISSDFVNEIFISINSDNHIFQSKNDLLIICAVLSYNRIIELKTLSDSDEIKLLKSFETKFTKRIKILAWFIQTAILVLFLYGVLKLISIKPEIEMFFDQIGSIFTILSLIGISQIGNISKCLRNKFYQILLLAFGYPLKLLNK